jgi:hypothetical protein
MQQIKQDLAAIEEKVAQLAVELRKLYGNYLDLLSQSARKQLILASYQICTQAYPEAFLKLSFSDRTQLQENLKKVGKTINTQLLAILEMPIESNNGGDREEKETSELSVSSSLETKSKEERPAKIMNLEYLVQWCKQVERIIQETLENLSQEANLYLQQAQILPPQVPAKVLEMAMQTEESNLSSSDSPNLLNLLVETERDSEEEPQAPKENAKLTKLTAIHLRLAEIEFSDPRVSIERHQIRNGLEKLRKIWQKYRQIEHEYAIAEAEAAWRASWYED